MNIRSLPILICDYSATGEGSTIIIKFDACKSVEELKKEVPAYFLLGSVIMTVEELLTNKYYSTIVEYHQPVFYAIISENRLKPSNLVVDYTYHANYS